MTHITKIAFHVAVGTVAVGGTVLSVPLTPILITVAALGTAVGGTVVAVKHLNNSSRERIAQINNVKP